MRKDITNRFKKKIFNHALSDANKVLDSNGERMKMFARIFFVIGIVAFSLPIFLFWRRLNGSVYFFISLLLTDIVFLIGSYIYPRIIACFSKWKYAAILHDEMGGFNSPNIKVDVNKFVDMKSWVTVQLTNNSRFPIKDCFIKIVDIEPPLITNLTSDVILEWTEHFIGQHKIEIGIYDGLQRHIANSVVASWIGNEQEREVFIFATEEPYKEHKFSGAPQKYRIVLEIHGNYLWEEFTQEEIVEIEPAMGTSLLESSINIRMIEKGNDVVK